MIGTDNVYSILPAGARHGTFITPDDNVNHFIREGKGIKEILKIISDGDFYDAAFLQRNFHKEIRKLQISEMRSDAGISECILENRSKKRLFLNEKHMGQYLIVELSKKVLNILGIPWSLSDTEIMKKDLLTYRASEVPVYPSVIEKLSLKIYEGMPRYKLFTFGGGRLGGFFR